MVLVKIKERGKKHQRAEFEALIRHEHEIERRGLPAELQSTGNHELGRSIQNWGSAYIGRSLAGKSKSIENPSNTVSTSVPRDVSDSSSKLSSVMREDPSGPADLSSVTAAKTDSNVCDVCGKDFPIASKLKYVSL
jgi:hypothetical protein